MRSFPSPPGSRWSYPSPVATALCSWCLPRSVDVFSNLPSTISSVAPFSIYDQDKAKRRRRKRSKKMICPELMSIWRNAATILSPVNITKKSITTSSYHMTVGLSTPIPLPIHGFFEDADGYKTKYLVPGKNWAPSLPLSFHLVWPLASSQMLDLSLFLTMSSMGTSMKPARVGFYMPSSMRWRRRGTRGLRWGGRNEEDKRVALTSYVLFCSTKTYFALFCLWYYDCDP